MGRFRQRALERVLMRHQDACEFTQAGRHFRRGQFGDGGVRAAGRLPGPILQQSMQHRMADGDAPAGRRFRIPQEIVNAGGAGMGLQPEHPGAVPVAAHGADFLRGGFPETGLLQAYVPAEPMGNLAVTPVEAASLDGVIPARSGRACQGR